MKRLLLLLLLFVSFNLFSQVTPSGRVSVANATTDFLVTIPNGFTVVDLTTHKEYLCITGALSTDDLTSASAKFLLTPTWVQDSLNVRLYGSGTTNYISKWTNSKKLGNSLMYDNGTGIGIGTTEQNEKLTVNGSISFPAQASTIYVTTPGFNIDGKDLTIQAGNGGAISVVAPVGGNLILKAGIANSNVAGRTGGDVRIMAGGNGYENLWYGNIRFYTGNTPTELMTILSTGNVGINTVLPYYKGDIAGDFRIQGAYKQWFGGTTGVGTDYIYASSAGILSTASQIASTLAIGTSPFAVTSTTVNANLNSNFLQGKLASDFILKIDSNKTAAGNYVTRKRLDSIAALKQNVSDTSVKDATRYWVGLQGYLTAYVETDPIWVSDSIDYLSKWDTNSKVASRKWVVDRGYLTVESDPVWITDSTDFISKWDTSGLAPKTYVVTHDSSAKKGIRSEYVNHDTLVKTSLRTEINNRDTLTRTTLRTERKNHDTLVRQYARDRDALRQLVSDTSVKDATRFWVGQQNYLIGNQTITLSGDVSGTGTTAITATVADDSHNHIISNTDGLQDSLTDSWNKQDTATALLSRARAISTYEPKIATGTTLQYWRGDKSWQTLPTTFAISAITGLQDTIDRHTDTAQSHNVRINARALKTTTISTISPLTGGGDLSANRTFAIDTTKVVLFNDTLPNQKIATKYEIRKLIPQKPGNQLVIFGNSITRQCTDTDLEFNNAAGYYGWGNAYLGSMFDLLNNAGVGGNKTWQMLARITTDVLYYNPSYCIVLAGTNDIGNGGQADTVFNNLKTIWSTLQVNGIIPIVATVMESTGITGGEETQRVKLNDSIKAYSARNNIYLFDFDNGFSQATMTVDGVHPNPYGATQMGEIMFNALEGKIVPITQFGCATTNTNIINSNPLMTGTGGTVGSGTITGNLADDVTWTLTAGSAVGSKITRDCGDWQKIVLSSAHGAMGAYQSIYSIGSYVGDSVYMQMEVKVESYDTIRDITCMVRTVDSAGANIYYQKDLVLGSIEADIKYAPINRTIVLKTPFIVVTSNAERIIWSLSLTASNATFDFGRVEVLTKNSTLDQDKWAITGGTLHPADTVKTVSIGGKTTDAPLGIHKINNKYLAFYSGNTKLASVYVNNLGSQFWGSNIAGINSTGKYITATGDSAGYSLTSGEYNNFNGAYSGYNTDVGVYNAAFAPYSLFSNEGGGYNSTFGGKSLYSAVSATNNSMFGYATAYNLASGNYNSIYGSQGLKTATSGTGSAGVGFQVLYSQISADYNIGLGYKAGYYETGSNKLYIENSDADSLNAMIYADMAKNWMRINGTLKIKTIPNSTSDTIMVDSAGIQKKRLKSALGIPAVGDTTGEMSYWNGTSWQPSYGAYLKYTQADRTINMVDDFKLQWNGSGTYIRSDGEGMYTNYGWDMASLNVRAGGTITAPAQKLSATDTTGKGSTANVGTMMYYNGHFYGLIGGAPPTWKQLDQ